MKSLTKQRRIRLKGLVRQTVGAGLSAGSSIINPRIERKRRKAVCVGQQKQTSPQAYFFMYLFILFF